MNNDMQTPGSAATIPNDCYFMTSEFAKVVSEHEFREANAIAQQTSMKLVSGLKFHPSIVSLLFNDVMIYTNEQRDTF